MRSALAEYFVSGIETNLGMFRRIVNDDEFLRGEMHTRWLDGWLTTGLAETKVQASKAEDAAVIAAVLRTFSHAENSADLPRAAADSRWKLDAIREQIDRAPRKSG